MVSGSPGGGGRACFFFLRGAHVWTAFGPRRNPCWTSGSARVGPAARAAGGRGHGSGSWSPLWARFPAPKNAAQRVKPDCWVSPFGPRFFGAGKRAQKGDQEGRAGQNRRLGRCLAGGCSRARRASGGARRPPGAVVIQGRARWAPPSLEPQRSGGASGPRWRAPGGVGVGSPARVPSREARHRRCRLGRRRKLRGNAFEREAAPRREGQASRPLFSGRAPSGRPGFLGREVSAFGSVGSGCRG